MSSSAKIRCNGSKLRQLRVQQSMTQEKLAAMSKVTQRTVQRAERGEFLQLDTLASLADTLRVTVSDLSMVDDHGSETSETPEPEPDERNAVVLRRVTAGKILVDMLCDSFSGKVYCATEPTETNIIALTTIVEKIESLMPNPWQTPMENVTLTLAQRLREALALTVQITELEKHGVAVFAGTYTARARVPEYDMDEGHMYTRTNQKYEPVTVCRISVNPIGVERVTVKVSDEWQEPAPALGPQISVDDDIPF
jgi:transcriptional regulator with XRE-family HTH domain